jgi:hypothetical protein
MRTTRFAEAIRVRLPSGLRAQLDAAAAREEKTHSEIIRDASLGSDRQECDDE